MKTKILYIKSLVPQLLPTETLALNVLKETKYDYNPLINKRAIENAFKLYKNKLNLLNSNTIISMTDINLNIEGNFLAQNIPEIPSIVVNEICTKDFLYRILDKYDDITHIGLSSYATGMNNTIDIIKTIQSEFPHLKLIIGGVGTVYSEIQKLMPSQNICIGDGVNFIRKMFNLRLLSREEYKIPKIFGYLANVTVPIKASYMVTQLGCPHNCNFCITTNFFRYFPFSNYKKIIQFIEDLCLKSRKDIFICLCDPNGLYPESQWKKVFNYFIDNPKKIENNIFLSVLASLNHINKFDLETIQKKSKIKIFLVNYGIESTIQGGYLKNKGNYDKIIKRLNNSRIITFQTCILGLPIHTHKNIHKDIKNNCNLKSDVISFNTFKPIPLTPLYNQLKKEGRIFGEELPPEFLYFEGFMPFKHPHLGFGFDILPYAFESYYECEKTLIDVSGNIAKKFSDLFALSNSRKLRQAVKIFIEISKKNYDSFQLRMPKRLSQKYKLKLNKNIEQISSLQ